MKNTEFRIVVVVAVVLLGIFASPSFAAKVVLEKEPVFSEESDLVGFVDFDAHVLDLLKYEVIADYDTFMVGEVEESSLEGIRNRCQAAGDRLSNST